MEEEFVNDTFEIHNDTNNLETPELNETSSEESIEDATVENPTTPEEQDPAKEKESILDRLMGKVFGKKEDKPSDIPGSNNVEEDISDSFTNAARSAGWSDEQIIKVADEYSNSDLEKLIPFIDVKKTEDKPVVEDKKTEDKKVVDSLNIDDKTLKSYLEKIESAIDAKYQEKFGKIEQGLKTAEQDRSHNEAKQYQTTADNFFDKASKDFPVFGTTDKLLRFPEGTPQAGQIIPAGEAFEARNAVWKAATAFHAMGEDWNKSLEEALVWYKGKTMEKDVRSKVLKDLKSKEKKLSPKRSERSVNNKKMSPDEEKDEAISDLMRRAGIN